MNQAAIPNTITATTTNPIAICLRPMPDAPSRFST
jgi:hypothetical protein